MGKEKLKFIAKKVSFDYDSTLSRKDVQIYAKSLIDNGHDVWIVTSRPEVYVGRWINHNPNNDDLFKVAESLGIIRENIVFTNYVDKYEYIADKGFTFHIDDDFDELHHFLVGKDSCKPINVHYFDWKAECEKCINE